MQRNRLKFVILILITVVALSCNRKAQLVYLGNVQNENFSAIQPPKYLLKPGDVLSVQIITQDGNISKRFNPAGGVSSLSSDAEAYLSGYTVSDTGTILLPVIGLINISGISVQSAQAKIQTAANQYLTEGIVILKLLSFKVTVIGEVKKPGTFTNYKDNLNVFEAIGLAGDLSDYAERSKVLIVRQTNEGLKTSRINLNDKAILSYESFYLMPNDIVIVEPRKGKVFNLNSPNVSLFLSIVSTTLLLLRYMKL